MKVNGELQLVVEILDGSFQAQRMSVVLVQLSEVEPTRLSGQVNPFV